MKVRGKGIPKREIDLHTEVGGKETLKKETCRPLELGGIEAPKREKRERISIHIHTGITSIENTRINMKGGLAVVISCLILAERRLFFGYFVIIG